MLGLESRVKHHLLDVLEEHASLDDALVADKHTERLFLLAAAQAREKDEVDTDKMRALIAGLRERFDYVLIDCPAGIELGFKNAVAGADEAIVVCTPEVSAVRDVDRVVGLLGNKFRPQLIVNRLRPNLVKKGKMLSVEDVNGILRLPLLGVIADEPEIIVTTNRGEPLALRKDLPTGAAYHAIAARLAGDDVPAPMPEVKADVVRQTRGALRRQTLMIEFLKRIFGQTSSSATAKERLRLVLMTDHLELAPDMIEAMKRDLVDVISRYVEVDRDRIEVNFEQHDKALAMLANIPILSVNRPNADPPPKESELPLQPEPAFAVASAPNVALARRASRHRRPSAPATP